MLLRLPSGLKPCCAAMNPLILGSLFGEGGCPVRSYLDYVRLVAEATMVHPPADGKRHERREPEQVADGEAKAH